jgi:hypothetical protein
MLHEMRSAPMSADPDHPHTDGHDHDHGQEPPSATALRVKALESLLVEKGLVDPAALDAIIDYYENKVGPRNGARVVARAWTDPAYKVVSSRMRLLLSLSLVTPVSRASTWWLSRIRLPSTT